MELWVVGGAAVVSVVVLVIFGLLAVDPARRSHEDYKQ